MMKVTLGQTFVIDQNQELVERLNLPYNENPNEVLGALSGKPLVNIISQKVLTVERNPENGAFFLNTGEENCKDFWDSADIILEDIRGRYRLVKAEMV